MAVAPEGINILKKLFIYLNQTKKDSDFEIYDINLIDKNNKNQIYMSITTILKEYPKIMKESPISEDEYKSFSDELKIYALDGSNNNKSCCDLILFDIICSMRLDSFYDLKLENVTINTKLDVPEFFVDTTDVYPGTTIRKFIDEENVKNSLKIINEFIKDFSISMEKKYKLYKILHILLTKIYDNSKSNSEKRNT